MNIYLLIANRNNLIDNIRQKQTMSLWGRTLSERGHNTKIIDIEKDPNGKLINQINKEADITITWNANCRNIKVGADKYYLNELKTKNLCRLVEHPIAFFLDYWETRGANQYNMTCNTRHNLLIEEEKLGTVVNTSKLTPLRMKNVKPKSHAKKYSLIVAAQDRGDARDLIFWSDKSKQTQEFYENIVQNALFNDCIDIYKEYKNKLETLTKSKISIIDHQFVLKKLYWIQKKIERRYAIDYAIKQFEGEKMLIGNWEHLYGRRVDVSIMPCISPDKISQIYNHGRFVLCINELDGGLERASEAADAGAYPIGDAYLNAKYNGYGMLPLDQLEAQELGDHLTKRPLQNQEIIQCVENL